MSKVRTHLVKALARKYEAEIAEAKATMEIYLDNSFSSLTISIALPPST